MTTKNVARTVDCREPAHSSDGECLQLRATVASERAVLEAQRSGDVATAALILSAVALLALIITILQGRAALRRSQKANEISEGTSKRQLRAYVVTRDLGFEWKFVVPTGTMMFTLWANMQNAGMTPTRSLKFSIGYDTRIPDDIFEKIALNADQQSSQLGPGSSFRTPEIAITDDVVNAAFTGGTKIYFFGAAFYEDVFGADCVTRFCFEVRFSKSRDSDRPDFINWIAVGPHNCADDECPIVGKQKA